MEFWLYVIGIILGVIFNFIVLSKLKRKDIKELESKIEKEKELNKLLQEYVFLISDYYDKPSSNNLKKLVDFCNKVERVEEGDGYTAYNDWAAFIRYNTFID